MNRFIVIFTIALACGCSQSDDRSNHVTESETSPTNSSEQTTAFAFDEIKRIISLNTRVAPSQKRRFDIGQGSITIETMRVKDDQLTFQYTPEVEGEYTTYECNVSISPTPVTVKIGADGTPGKTSFDLSKCNVIQSGNVLLDGQPNETSNRKKLAPLFVTPESDDFYELAQQLLRRRVFLHVVKSPWRCGGWYPAVPKAHINREQPIATLLQAMADEQDVELVAVRNSVGQHYLFSRTAPDEQLEKLREALAVEDSKLQKKRLRETSVYFDLRIVPIVARHLKNEDQKSLAREILLSHLGMTHAALMLPETDAIAFLENEFRNGNRLEAVRSLGSIGGSGAIRLLRGAITDQNKEVRRTAAQALQYIRGESSLRILESAMTDADLGVRQAVAEAFSWSDNKQARNALEKLITDEDSGIRSSATSALGWHGTAANKLLARTILDNNSDVRLATMVSLGKVGDQQSVVLLGSALRDADYLVRESAAESLGIIGTPAVISVLEKAVHADSTNTRWAAAGALGRIRSNESLNLLKKLIDDVDIDVQKRSVYHLGIFKEDVALPLLKQATEKYECCHIQSAAAAALGEIGGEKSVSMLSELLDRNTRKDYWDVRRDIANALGTIGSDNAVQQLRRILNEEVPSADANERETSLILATRRGAINALGVSDNRNAVPLLAKELQHDDRPVRHDAINALARIGGSQTRDLLIRHLSVNPHDVETVRQALRDRFSGDKEVRKLLGYEN